MREAIFKNCRLDWMPVHKLDIRSGVIATSSEQVHEERKLWHSGWCNRTTKLWASVSLSWYFKFVSTMTRSASRNLKLMCFVFWARTDICLFYPWWSGPLRLTTHKHIIHSQHDTLTERLSRLDMLVVISVTSHHGQRIQRLWNKDRFLQLYASLTALHCFPIMPPFVLLEWEGGSKQRDLSALCLLVFFNDEVFG